MKLAATVALSVLLPTTFSSPSAAGPETVVVASVDSSRVDAFVGNLRFARADLVYASRGASEPLARRVGIALGAQVRVDAASESRTDDAANALVNQVLTAGGHRVVVVLVEPNLALPFLRRLTDEPRSSFPLSGAPGRMWIVSRGSDQSSAIRGSF